MSSVLDTIKCMGSRIRQFVRTGSGNPLPCFGRGRGAVPCGRMEKVIARRLADTGSRELRWARVDMAPPVYELTAGGETVAILCGEVDLRTVACARTADGEWSIAFERRGPQANHVVARSPETGAEIATFEWRLAKTRLLDLANGHQYQWSMARLLPPLWHFTGADDKPLVTISAEVLAPREQGSMDLSPDVIGLEDLPLLAVLALYVYLLGSHKQAEWAT
jgi:hypothetical protein